MEKTAKKTRKTTHTGAAVPQDAKLTKAAAKPISEPMLVIIPYLPSEAQGQELLLAITGWERYCKFPHHIVVVGEGLQAVSDRFGLDGRVQLVESPRVAEKAGNYRSHLDYVSCLRKVRSLFPESKEYIFVADDCFPVNDFTLDDVRALYEHPVEFVGEDNPYNGWRRDALKTRRKLDEMGLPHRNFTTHLPQLFEWDKWEAIVKQYDMDNESYVIEALYYNTYFADQQTQMLCHDTDAIRCWMGSSSVPAHDARLALDRKKWICCSVDGYSYIIEDLLKAHYGLD